MNNQKILFLLVILGAVLLSACTGSALTASSWPGITATEDTVYVAYGPHVYALDAESGSQRWQFPAEADNSISFYSAPALGVDREQLIVGGYDNVLYSLDPNGALEPVWTYEGAANRYIGSAFTTGSGVYAPNANGRLYAFDYQGNDLWGEPYSADDPIWSSPVADDKNIYVSALDHHLHAVDASTGREVWAQDLETVSVSTPALYEGVLYASTFGNKVFAVDADRGNVLWTFETEDWAWSSPTVADGIVYVGDVSGKFYAVDAGSGKLLWDFAADGGIFGGALVVDDIVYFGTENGFVYALTSDGEREWFHKLTGKVYSAPVTNGEYLYIASIEGDALVTALEFNGTARWPFAPEN